MLRDMVDCRGVEGKRLCHVVAAGRHESRVIEIVTKVAHVGGNVRSELQKKSVGTKLIMGSALAAPSNIPEDTTPS